MADLSDILRYTADGTTDVLYDKAIDGVLGAKLLPANSGFEVMVEIKFEARVLGFNEHYIFVTTGDEDYTPEHDKIAKIWRVPR